MIAFLKGTLAGKTATTAYIEVNGVGYAVGMSQASLSKLPEAGAPVEVHTFLQVRDDALALYGFLALEEKALFERLIGVGKKTASRISLELKGSFDEGLASLFDGAAPAAASAANLAGTREALLSMGFTSEEADVALKGAPEGASEGVLLQYALKRIGSAGLPTGGMA